MKLLLCLVLVIAIFKVQCEDVPTSQEATKDETQQSEDQGTNVEENTEITNDNIEDYYDSSEYWDSLEDTDVEDSEGVVKPTGMPETNSVDVDEGENQFLDDSDDDDDDEDEDDDVAWLMDSNSDAQLEDGEDIMESREHDDSAEDKNNSGDTWSYTQYLEQKVKERAFRKYLFVIVGVSGLTLVALLLLIAMRLRKRSTDKKAMPYDHLHEEA